MSAPSQPLRTVAGAGLLSAAATLPLHLLPVLVLALGTSGTFDRGQAGSVGSAYMLGQLATVLLLPSVGVARVRWLAAFGAVLAVIFAAAASMASAAAIVVASWAAVGVMAGVLQYLANVTAAASPNRRAAFALRMAASSLTGAVLIGWLQVSDARIADYASVCLQLVIAFAALAAVGLALYRSDAPPAPPAPLAGAQASAVARPARIAGGLAVLFFLFVGQQGLWSIVMQSANARGFVLGNVMWTICAAKLLGASAVLLGNIREARVPTSTDLAVSGAIVAAGGLFMGMATGTLVYAAGLVIWEVALNVLSARYQALLACANPRAAGMWITAAIFLGAASGHAVAPFLTASGHLAMFMSIAVVGALAPATWASFPLRARKRGDARHVAGV